MGWQTSQQVSSASFLLSALYCSGGVCREEALGPSSLPSRCVSGFKNPRRCGPLARH